MGRKKLITIKSLICLGCFSNPVDFSSEREKASPCEPLRKKSRTKLSTLLATLTLLTTLPASYALPPGDPICSAPSSLIAVEKVRAAMVASRNRVSLQSARPQALAVAPTLSFAGWDVGNLPRLRLAGAAGGVFQLEATSDLGSTSWTPVVSGQFDSNPLLWRDDLAAGTARRFYRLASVDASAFTEPADNFRLLDQEGKVRELFYPTQLKAEVVVAAGDNLQQIAALAPILSKLTTVHGDKLQIWILLSSSNAVSSNVAAQASALGLNVPVLLDRAGVAGRAVRLTRVGEVAVIEPPAFLVAYRGAVTDGSTQEPERTLLGQALASVIAAQPFAYLRTSANGPLLASTSEPTPDYARDIAPILYRHCAICHRPGDVAPFAMTNYSVVQSWSPSIKHAVLSGKMPPWHADPEYGHWANDLSLPGSAKSALIRWLNAGAPRGAGSDPLAELPPPPAFSDWPAELGPPDALVSPPVQNIKAVGTEAYRYIFVQAPNPSNVWLRAAIIRPSNYRAVHHYLVWPGKVGNVSPLPDLASTYETALAGHVPGYKPFMLPPDTGISLTKSNWLTFNLHYTPYGQATNDLPVLALWYHRMPPAKTLKTVSIQNIFWLLLNPIPPGVAEYPVEAEWTASKTTRLHRFNPHMHLRGKRMSYEAIYPDGRREILLSVPDYDFNWQVGYELAEPKIIPAGTRIIARGAFDNSPQNLFNPDPTASVPWGDQSWSEMFVGFIDASE